MDFRDIVDQGHQSPLAVDLVSTAQTEAFEPERRGDVAEDRLDNPQAMTVGVAAARAIDLSSHPLRGVGFVLSGLAKLYVH